MEEKGTFAIFQVTHDKTRTKQRAVAVGQTVLL